MLRVTCIRQYGVRWSTSLFSNLHELVLSGIFTGAPDVDTFLELLSRSPKLTRLHVQNSLRADENSVQTRVVSLPCLQSLKLEHVETEALKQALNAIDIPTSAECSFLLAPDGDKGRDLIPKQLKPIDRRLAALAEASRGTKSTLTLGGAANMWGRSVRTTYKGEANHQHGPLTIDVERFFGNKIDIYEHFARQLGQLEPPNPVPPALHIVNCSDGGYVCNMSELLQRLHEHLPDTDEILIEDISLGFIEDAFGALFPSDHSSPRLFPKLSTLIIRNSEHKQWAHCLERRQQQQANWEGVNPWPIKTLKIECETISAEMVETLEKLVQNLVPIVLTLTDQTAPR
ncbi:hypothetical protein FS837_010361 [Tulasnella sp. UAMH 9824]|nr:hypothetical protein FS837_010361 [Tulasnella sp. UAMH 9824]